MKDNNKRNRTTNILLILVILMFLIILLLTFHSCTKKDDIPTPRPVGDSSVLEWDTDVEYGDLDKMSKGEIEKLLNDKVAKSNIRLNVNTSPVFENGTSKGNLRIVNEKVNNYPQTVTITDDLTDKIIYTSKAIPIGGKIEEAKLDVDLDKGVYNCTAYFNMIDPDTGDIVGTAGAEMVITINN